MVINPMPTSGASIFYSYKATANSLLSPADVSMCPDPSFLVKKSVAYFWQARDDGRSVQAMNDSDRILGRMLEEEMTKGHSYDDRVQTAEETRYGFRLGRN